MKIGKNGDRYAITTSVHIFSNNNKNLFAIGVFHESLYLLTFKDFT